MNNQLEIISTSFEKIQPKDGKMDFWSFMSLIGTLIFITFYLVFLTPVGWLSIAIISLIYKFIIT
jgi:hypothetical protein